MVIPSAWIRSEGAVHCSVVANELFCFYAPVAQLDRASVCGTEGRRFESRRVHQFKNLVKIRIFILMSYN